MTPANQKKLRRLLEILERAYHLDKRPFWEQGVIERVEKMDELEKNIFKDPQHPKAESAGQMSGV